MQGESKKHLLAVAMWPVGGIRTYMKYTYRQFPSDCYNITILARRTAENQALLQDAEACGAKVVTVEQEKRILGFVFAIIKIHWQRKIDLIQSHGFSSAIYVSIFSYFFRVRHVFSIHGIFEERHLRPGWVGRMQKYLFRKAISRVDCIHAVSQDILDHVVDVLSVRNSVPRVVIHNGIDLAQFCVDGGRDATLNNAYREGMLGNSFLVGFVGRFMPEKGFEYLIDAVDLLKTYHGYSPTILRVLAVGSGDYLRNYQKKVQEKDLGTFFLFLPFQYDIQNIYRAVDLVAIPSLWEACPLQPMEALCVGTPIIASDCMGLREVTKGTPTITIPAGNALALADAIHERRLSSKLTDFQAFIPEACVRFDVKKSAEKLDELFGWICGKNRHQSIVQAAQRDWRVLDRENGMLPQGIRLVSHEHFSGAYYNRQMPVEVIEQGKVSRLLIRWEGLSFLLWAIHILWVSDKQTVILANGSTVLGNYICLLNYYLFFRTRIILFWDSHLEPRTTAKKYFARRCFLGCRLATMWSRQQVQNYAREFNLPEDQFIFIPYKANHSKSEQRVLPSLEYIFAGGNGKRDYQALVEAVRGTDITVIISTTRTSVKVTIEDLPNVIPLAATEPSYAKLMAASQFVVIPMVSTGLKGGGEANFCNAMWHRKPVVAMDDVSAVDYIVEGETGYVVPPGDVALLRKRMLELWRDKAKCKVMGAKGHERVKQDFTHDLCINRLIRLAYLVGEDAFANHFLITTNPQQRK